MIAPVKSALESFKYVQLFLESTLYTIVAFILILSAMLIYSLMISDIDEKTYEMAMLRALGLRSSSLVNLIMIQALVFAFPGILLGLILSGVANLGLRIFIMKFTVSNISYFLASASISIGVFLGIFMPIFTNIFTVKRALSKQIRDSLDIFHTGANDVIIKIIRLEDYGISLFSTSLGLILVVMGVMTYYMAPAAFLFDKMELFFVILNLILIFMIIGMGFV